MWPSQGTKPEERLDKYKWLKLPSQGSSGFLTLDDEAYVIGGDRGNVVYVIGGDRGKVMGQNLV